MATVITKQNIMDFVVTGEFDIAASVKPEKDSRESKQVTLRFKMSNTPITDIIASSLKDKRINWQVGARTKFDDLNAGSIVTVDYRGGKQTIDPETATVNFLSAMTDEQRAEWIEKNLKPRSV